MAERALVRKRGRGRKVGTSLGGGWRCSLRPWTLDIDGTPQLGVVVVDVERMLLAVQVCCCSSLEFGN